MRQPGVTAARAARVAIAVSSLALVIASAAAIVTLRGISTPASVDVVVPPASVHVDSASVSGVVRDGLPAFALHWDGQPPSALLVDKSSGAVLAASAFSEATFSQNRSAVRFTDGIVKFVLDSRRWSPDTQLLVRVEAVEPRTWFLFWGAVAALAGVVLTTAIAIAFDRRPLQLAGSLLFIAIAVGTFTSVYPGAPVRVDELTDEASINSFAAARDNPSAFALDKLLSDRSNYEWYPPAYVNVVRASKRLGFHYQTAEAFLGAAGALIFLFGLRRLFTVASGRADVGLAATLALGLFLDSQLPPDGEFWSTIWVLPRTIFTAFVPWVLLLTLVYVGRTRRWWIPCVAASLLVHIHPLSTPVLVATVVGGLFFASDAPIRERVVGVVLSAVAVVLTMLPYAVVYLRHAGRATVMDAETSRQALMLIRGSFDHVREGVVVRELIRHRVQTFRILLDIAAVVLLLRSRRNQCLRFYAGCVAGFALVTFVLPALDAAYAAWLDRRQLAYELIRSVRYFDFVVVAGIAVAAGGWRGAIRHARIAAALAAACVVLAFGSGWLKTAQLVAGRSRFAWRMTVGRPDVESAAAQEAIRAMAALRARDERVAGPVGLRQFGVPLAWTERDVASLSYSMSRALVESAAAVPRVRAILERPVTEQSVVQLSSVLDAQLFLLRRRQLTSSLDDSSRVLFQNAVYAIVSVSPEPRHVGGGRVGRSTAHESADVASPAT